MALTKFGTGDVIGPDDENLKKQATDLDQTWTTQDSKDLAEENED